MIAQYARWTKIRHGDDCHATPGAPGACNCSDWDKDEYKQRALAECFDAAQIIGRTIKSSLTRLEGRLVDQPTYYVIPPGDRQFLHGRRDEPNKEMFFPDIYVVVAEWEMETNEDSSD